MDAKHLDGQQWRELEYPDQVLVYYLITQGQAQIVGWDRRIKILA